MPVDSTAGSFALPEKQTASQMTDSGRAHPAFFL
jgi:hypothetical protein